MQDYTREPLTFFKVIIILASVTAIFTMFQTWTGFQNWTAASKQSHWQTADGHITSLTVDELHYKKRYSKADDISYRPRFYYEYTVPQGKYVGSFKLYMEESAKREEAEAGLKDYPIGRALQVYYDPDKPDNSVLARFETGKALNGLVQSAATFCVSLVVISWAAGRETKQTYGIPTVNFRKYRYPRSSKEFFE